jgi:hypothetical protein
MIQATMAMIMQTPQKASKGWGTLPKPKNLIITTLSQKKPNETKELAIQNTPE